MSSVNPGLMPDRFDDDMDQPSLPPAPGAWVARVEELPLLELALAVVRESPEPAGDVTAMRSALQAVGLEPDERRLRAFARLRALRSGD